MRLDFSPSYPPIQILLVEDDNVTKLLDTEVSNGWL